jgi:hypothetical protein
MFKNRYRPNGLEFASCNDCNTGTRGADVVASFLARLSPFDEADNLKIKEANKLRFFADRAAKKWPLRGSLKLG